MTNQFSEFYHNTTDAKQGLHHFVNQPLEIHGKENALLLDIGTNIIIFSNK